MNNYTTQTAALKAVTIDTAKIDAKQIDTKKLFINGELFDPSQIKESPNQKVIMLSVSVPFTTGSKTFDFSDETSETLISGEFENNQIQFNIVELLSALYPDENSIPESMLFNLLSSNCFVAHVLNNNFNDGMTMEPCMLDFHRAEYKSGIVTIKLGEEDDNLEELYGGYTITFPSIVAMFMFYISMPYATPQTQSSSTYSLRQPEVTPSLLEKARQIFEERKQQILDNSAE